MKKLELKETRRCLFAEWFSGLVDKAFGTKCFMKQKKFYGVKK